MDIRTYLTIEIALTKRLQKTWQEISAPIYAKIQEAVSLGQWDKARQLVNQLDLTPVGQQNKDYIKYMLQAAASFGAMMTNAGETWVHNLPEANQVMNNATQQILLFCQHNGTALVREAALQSIADAQQESVKKKEHEYGNTQINIPEDSDGGRVLDKLRSQISDEHLSGDGKDIGHNHCTVRYGIDSDDVDGIRDYIQQLRPFTAKLGRVTIFPPSKNSEGASPIVISVEAPELTAINKEMGEHGEFIEPTFKEYKPHATLAYVNPDHADKYKDLDAGGVEFPVNSITISHKNGKQEEVPFNVTKEDVTSAILIHGGKLNPQQSLVPPRKKKIIKDEPPRFIKPLTSFADGGFDQLQLIASLNSSRVATWGFTAEAAVRNIQRYKLQSILDGRTSPFCREVANGREFDVADARTKVLQALNVQDPNALKSIQPWPRQDKASIAAYKEMSDDDLMALGLHTPPFHPRCRTIATDIGMKIRTEKPEIQEADKVIPSEITTPQTFAALGQNVSQQETEHWNAYMGVNPISMLSHIAGVDPVEIMGNKWKKMINFMDNGDISTSIAGVSDGVKLDVGTTLDPYSGSMYVDSLDTIGDLSDASDKTGAVLGGLVEVGKSIGATSLTVDSGAQSDNYITMGFLPSPVAWQRIRMDASESLGLGGNLGEMYDSLTPDQQILLQQILADQNEEAAKVLIDMPWEFQGYTVGEWVFANVTGKMTLDLTNKDMVANALEYLS